MTFFGQNSISDLRLGDSQVQAAYLGDQLVWSHESPQPSYWGLCLTALEDNSTVSMARNGNPPIVNLLYSTDTETWNTFTVGSTTVTLAHAGDKVWFKAGPGGNTRLGSGDNSQNYFVMTGKLAGSGSILSLLDETEGNITQLESTRSYTFIRLFWNCTALQSFAYDDFPSIPIYAQAAIRGVFENTSIKVAPRLDISVVSRQCCDWMFYDCHSLTAVPPILPATTVARNCYSRMFSNCTALSSAAEMILPATGQAGIGSYESMFNGCVSLTAAPYFKNSSLNNGTGYSYKEMFRDCSCLAQISVSLTAWPTNNSCNDWVNNVSSYGTFYCPTALGTNATIARGNNNCPTNWTVVNTDA